MDEDHLRNLSPIELEAVKKIIPLMNDIFDDAYKKNNGLTYNNMMNMLTSITANYANELASYVPLDENINFGFAFRSEFNRQLMEKMDSSVTVFG